MAFARPTLSELVDRIQQDLTSRLNLTSPILRRSVVYVLARVLAGVAHLLYGHLEYLSQQVFPDLSDGPYLLRQAALFGFSPTPAAFAVGNVTLTGTDGSVVPDGTLLQRADGTEYATQELVTIASGTATVAVSASLAGEAGSCDEGTQLSFESPIAGVTASATVATGGITGGADQETIDALRLRLLARMRQAPHGGAAFDYIAWALEVPGVTRAWCYPLEGGDGTVTVRFVRDNDTSFIPDSGEVAAVQAHIDALRPVTATVTVAAPTADPIAITVSITPDTTATRAAVAAELADLILRDAAPGGIIRRSRLELAIGTAAGVTDFTLSVPSADSTHATGHIATLGAITWV